MYARERADPAQEQTEALAGLARDSRTYRGATVPTELEKFSLSSSEDSRVERREWWTFLEKAAVTAAQEEHPIRLALARVWKLLIRPFRSACQADQGVLVREKTPTSSGLIEEAVAPSETEEPTSLASSDDPRDLIE